MGETRNRIISRSNSLPEPQRPTLRKTLGVFDGVAILIGITIGTSICSTHQIIAGYHESFYPIIALWILVDFFVFLGAAYALVGFMLAVDRPVEVWRSLTTVYLPRLPRPLVKPRNDGYGKEVANINDLYLIIPREL